MTVSEQITQYLEDHYPVRVPLPLNLGEILLHAAGGTLRILEAPDSFLLRIDILDCGNLENAAYANGLLTVDFDDRTVYYRPFALTDAGVRIAFTRTIPFSSAQEAEP